MVQPLVPRAAQTHRLTPPLLTTVCYFPPKGFGHHTYYSFPHPVEGPLLPSLSSSYRNISSFLTTSFCILLLNTFLRFLSSIAKYPAFLSRIAFCNVFFSHPPFTPVAPTPFPPTESEWVPLPAPPPTTHRPQLSAPCAPGPSQVPPAQEACRKLGAIADRC